MKRISIRERLMASTVAGTAAVLVMAAVPAVALLTPSVVVAQDYTSGTLGGRVQNNGGEAVAGATVTVRSTEQGITRTTTTDANGAFRLPLIPVGRYDVTVAAAGFDELSDQVAVGLGGQSSYDFTVQATGSADTADLGDIVVTGVRRQLDFSQTTTGATLEVDELVDQIPVGRSVTAVTLLAPGTVAGDSAFAVSTSQLQTPPSISGASVAENAYFVNGLNTTNFVNGLGGAGVPFEFYKTVEVKTGGYAAEYGRATGGVVNAITKSGSNDFVVELHTTWAPDSLREDAPNTVTNVNRLSESEQTTATLEVGGPVLRDRLFAYGLVSYTDTDSQVASTGGVVFKDTFSKDPFYGVKVDGYITSDHRLEFTYFNTESTRTREAYSFDTDTLEIDPALNSTQTLQQGGENFVGRYTGRFTDWLTVSAAYGESTSDLASLTDLVDESRVIDYRTNSSGEIVSRQSSGATNFPFTTERTFYRADADIFANLFGEHHIRFGLDHEETLLEQFSTPNGGRSYDIFRAAATNSLGLAEGQEYFRLRVFRTGGGFSGENEAIYIQDSWDVTSNLNLQLGWRQDKFAISDPNGTPFIDFDNEQALRAGFSFDPTGDRTSKFYGSYGRYYLPPASNTAFRIASPAIDFYEYFRPSGGGMTIGALDPVTGLPVAGLGPQITAATGATGLQACPDGLGALAPSGAVACSVRDDGTSTPPEYITASNLKSTYEDEFRFGYEHKLGDLWTLGVGATYRRLGRVVEDALLDAGVVAYCEREGIPLVIGSPTSSADGRGCAEIYNGQHYYLIVNPGEDVTATLPDLLAGETEHRTITMSAEDLGMPKARREYAALEFTFQRAFDGVWGVQGSYVLSRSEGNYEGAVKSDTGQTDAGIVSDFDFVAFYPGQYGLLPNHRGHQFKAYGSWQATPQLLVGANYSLTSPRAYGCMGNAPADYYDGDVANDSYGPLARFCNGRVVDRGSSFETDWVNRFDLSFRYSLDDLVPGNLVLRADIFNVFNLQSVTEAWEYGEQAGGAVDDQYGDPLAYQAGRSVRIGFDWAF